VKRSLAPLLAVAVAATAGVALTTASAASAASAPRLDQKTIFMMDDITAVFEQSKSAPQYSNIENDNDGCGWTAGWIGFCTETGDMLDLVKKYNAANPDNVLKKYTATLQKLADDQDDSTAPLGSGFPSDWKTAAKDPVFVQTQLKVGHDDYLTPALTVAGQIGVKTNLGVENLFDTALMMGPASTDCDGMPNIVKETTKAVGGTPATGVSEATFFKQYNTIRIRHMKNPCTPGRQNDWPDAVGRAQALQKLWDTGHTSLAPSITIAGGFDITISNPHD
jgi:chitosanase